MRHRRNGSIATLLRHPLVVAVLLYVPLASAQWLKDVRLLALEPVALAAADASETPEGELSDYDKLKRELAGARQKLADLGVAYDAQRNLYEQLSQVEASLGNDALKKAIPARIILRGDASNWRHTVYINRGTSKGVAVGHAVTVGRTLVGRVIAANMHVSAVQLATDPGFAAPVCIVATEPVPSGRPDDSPPGLVSGATRGVLRGNGSIKPRLPVLPMVDVELGATVEEGMAVVTNGTTGEFPAGLHVGRVLKSHHRGTFLEVDVEAAFDLAMSDVVLVIPYERPTLDEIAGVLAGQRSLDDKAVSKTVKKPGS